MVSSQQQQPTYAALAATIRALGKRVHRGRGFNGEAINAVEQMYNVLLPQDYRQFLSNYGLLRVGDISIYGLGDASDAQFLLENALLMIRLAHPKVPLNLVPVEDLGGGQFACLSCMPHRSGECPVVLLDVAEGTFDHVLLLAPSFRSYLYNRLLMLGLASSDGDDEAHMPPMEMLPAHKIHGLAVLEQHVKTYQKRFGYDHATGGKLPRNHDWRPYRFCIQDVLFGTTVVRHSREHNCLEIDVFLTANIPEYDELAGAQALACFLLSEAYKCGGTMELRFTREVEGGPVPAELQALAGRYGVPFAEAAQGRVTPTEAKAFYARLTGFSPALQEQLTTLEQAGTIKMTRACYAVHNGVWSREQVEMIVLGSQRPDSVLAGLAQPHQRHLYQHDLLQARAALLGGLLDRQLSQRQRADAHGTSYDLEDDLRNIVVGFDGAAFAKTYISDEALPLPWLYPERTLEIQPENQLNVLIRARDSADLFLHLAADLEAARQLRERGGHPSFVVVPRDFFELPESFRQQILAKSDEIKIRLMVCPEAVQSLDVDAAARLARSRLLRK